MAEPFVAEIKMMACNFAPRGFAFCNGQLLPIAQNTALFSLIGTTYGGDGRTTTALPNLQGRAPLHPGRGPGLTSRRLGQNIGGSTVTLQESQMPSHNHILRGTNDDAESSDPNGQVFAKANAAVYSPNTPNVAMPSSALAPVGGGQAHNNMMPYLVINFCIALIGLYPTRS